MTGTTGSGHGKDFAITNGCGSCEITATYSGEIKLASAAPLGDLWQVLDLSFAANHGAKNNFDFVLDTDNEVRVTTPVPEPETYALMLAGLGLTAAAMRRRGRGKR